MFNKININYMDIVEKEQTVISFLTKNSNSFAVTVLIKKPYSQEPPVFNYCNQIIPFAQKYIFHKNDWPVSFLGQLKHQIMVVCQCCKESCNELLKMPNLFLIDVNDTPEDICFFRNEKLLFATITHEKIAFMLNPTKEDIEFLKKHEICFYVD